MNVKPRHLISISLLVSLAGAGCFSSSETPSLTPEEAANTSALEMEAPVVQAATGTATASTTTSSTTEKVTTPPTVPTPTPKPKTPPTPKPTTKTVVVTISNEKYSPQVIAVNAGDTIMWVNKDTLPHTSKSDGALIWDSGTIRPGGTFKRVFAQPGNYTYSCGIHPHMKGTVVVK